MNPEWTNRALDQLADDWVLATPEERDEIEKAVRSANRQLADDPDIGESRRKHACSFRTATHDLVSRQTERSSTSRWR